MTTALTHEKDVNEQSSATEARLPLLEDFNPNIFFGTVQDLAKSKSLHDIINEYAPNGILEKAPLEVVEKLEHILNQTFGKNIGSYIHIGRKRFELISHEEAEMYRAERAEEYRLSLADSPVKKIIHEDSVVFAGLSNLKLFSKVIEKTQAVPGKVSFSNFANGETQVTVHESVRGRKAFILQTDSDPVNENAAELELLIDALKRASAKEINVVLPLFPYARQDCKGGKRSPVSAAAFAKRIKNAGADTVLTLDPHSPQIEGFFDGPFDNLHAGAVMVPHLYNLYKNQPLMIVAADEGQMKRLNPVLRSFEAYSHNNGLELDLAQATMKKTREKPNEVEKTEFIGNADLVKGRVVLLWDDMIDTGGTILKAVAELRKFNPAKVVVVATHGIFSYNGIERFRSETYFNEETQKHEKLIDKLVISNSLPLYRAKSEFIEVVPMEDLISEAIKRIIVGGGASLSELENEWAGVQ